MVGGIALMAFAAAAFTGTPEFGNFTDAGGSPTVSASMLVRSPGCCSHWR
jgi:hypothetical protein